MECQANADYEAYRSRGVMKTGPLRVSVHGLRTRALIVLVWRSGLRVSEALALPLALALALALAERELPSCAAAASSFPRPKGGRRRDGGMDSKAVSKRWAGAFSGAAN